MTPETRQYLAARHYLEQLDTLIARCRCTDLYLYDAFYLDVDQAAQALRKLSDMLV